MLREPERRPSTTAGIRMPEHVATDRGEHARGGRSRWRIAGPGSRAAGSSGRPSRTGRVLWRQQMAGDADRERDVRQDRVEQSEAVSPRLGVALTGLRSGAARMSPAGSASPRAGRTVPAPPPRSAGPRSARRRIRADLAPGQPGKAVPDHVEQVRTGLSIALQARPDQLDRRPVALEQLASRPIRARAPRTRASAAGSRAARRRADRSPAPR